MRFAIPFALILALFCGCGGGTPAPATGVQGVAGERTASAQEESLLEDCIGPNIVDLDEIQATALGIALRLSQPRQIVGGHASTDPTGDTTNRSRDDRGLLTELSLPGGVLLDFGYDNLGNLRSKPESIAVTLDFNAIAIGDVRHPIAHPRRSAARDHMP